MAAILIACSALTYQKIRDKRAAKQAKKREYDARFDELLAENARRVDRLSGACNGKLGPAESVSQSLGDQPPRYQMVLDGDERLKAKAKTEPRR